IVGFNDVGIAVYGPRTGVLLYGNSVGVLPDGTTVQGNNIGIQLAPLAGETAGPTEVSVGTGRYGDANLIGGNNDGLQILNAPQTFVVGNLIGVSLPSGPDPVNVGNANNGI